MEEENNALIKFESSQWISDNEQFLNLKPTALQLETFLWKDTYSYSSKIQLESFIWRDTYSYSTILPHLWDTQGAG